MSLPHHSIYVDLNSGLKLSVARTGEKKRTFLDFFFRRHEPLNSENEFVAIKRCRKLKNGSMTLALQGFGGVNSPLQIRPLSHLQLGNDRAILRVKNKRQ